MKRSKHQAVYKYLPGVWTSLKDDNIDRLGGNSVTIKIDGWNYRLLKDVFTEVITGEISRQLRNFQAKGGEVNSFNLDKLDEQLFYIEPAMIENIDDIVGSISPLVFYCSNCENTFSYSDEKYINKNTWICEKCKSKNIKQLQMVYVCPCGAAMPVTLPYKTIAGKKIEFKYNPIEGKHSPYKFKYIQNGKVMSYEMTQKCVCGNTLVPANASDGKNYRPFTTKIVNLNDQRQGNFYSRGFDSQRIIIANWLGIIDDTQYERIINNIDDFFYEDIDMVNSMEFKRKVLEYVDIFNLDEEEAKEKALNFWMKNNGNRNSGIQQKILSQMPNLSLELIGAISTQVIEYNTLRNAKRSISLQDAITIQKELNIITGENEIRKINKEYGISNAQISLDTEIISSTFGYSRITKDPNAIKGENKLALKSYRNDKEGKNAVYCSKLETEGILIDIDKVKIISWLLDNKIIGEHQLPDLDDDDSVKKWYIEHINPDEISSFSNVELNNPQFKITYYVYNLLHTISHAFIKSAGILSGLDKNSLAEMLFPNLASIYIYANTTQGVALGVLSGMFEQGYKVFVTQALDSMGRCVFDPICMERDNGSCSSCTHLAETSCCNFNKNLNRKLIVGYKSDEESIKGFWEF